MSICLGSLSNAGALTGLAGLEIIRQIGPAKYPDRPDLPEGCRRFRHL
jgi:hypothetical protein